MKQLTLILLLLLIFIGWGVARAQDPDAPFLFYYDDELNSFVLERADGHDYRLFLADTLPDNAAVYSYTWSWDYSYLAFNVYDGSNSAIWVANLDGEIVHRIDGVSGFMRWAPNNRYLLRYGSRMDSGRDRGSYIFDLIDLDTNRVISSYHEQDTTDSESWREGAGNLAWSPAGNMVGFLEAVYDLNAANTFKQQFTVLTVTGQVLHRDTDWAEFAPDGRLQYLDLAAHQLVLEDLTTQEITTFDLPPGEFYAIQWNPLGEQALVTMATNIGNGSNRCRCEFWVFDPQLSEFSLIVDDAQSFPQSPPAYRPVISELSPNWERLLYYRGETQGYHYLELTTMQSIPLNLPDAPDSSVWRWHNNDLLIPWPLQVGREFFTYNIPTRDVQEFVDLNHETLSPDGQYILNYFSPPIIYDLTNNSSTPLPPHSALHPSALKHITTQWHPEALWVRITENTAVSGGGGGPLLSSLVRADGAYRRENNPARWLPVEINPDTVTTIPYEPEPPILQPVEVLKTDHQSRALYWRPDGTQIAMDLDMTAQVGNQSQGPYKIWNIQTGTESVAFEVQAENVVFSWTVLDDGTFTPGIQHVPQDYLPLQSPDGRQYLAEGSDGYWLNLLDSDTEEAIAEINEIESWTSFSYHPNSLILAVASSDRGIRFYDTTTGTQLMEIPIHANAVAFSPNGEFLAVSISWEVHIYRLSDILDSAQQ